MFHWLKKLFTVSTLEPESLRFVRALCEKCPTPSMREDWGLGYEYRMFLYFDAERLEITIKYNTIRCQWDIQIWSSETGFLFYYDCLSPKPMMAINYLVNRFGLKEKMTEFVAQKKLQEQQKEDAAARLKSKYLEG